MSKRIAQEGEDVKNKRNKWETGRRGVEEALTLENNPKTRRGRALNLL
jgi:hypothetical protein